MKYTFSANEREGWPADTSVSHSDKRREGHRSERLEERR
jgi:hypothetical protein